MFSLISITEYRNLIIEIINDKLMKFGVRSGELGKIEMEELSKLKDDEITEKKEIDKIEKKIGEKIGEISSKNFLDQLIREAKSFLDKTKIEREKIKVKLIKFSESDNIFWKMTHQSRKAEVQQVLSSLETSSFSTKPTNYWPWILGGAGITAALGIVYLLIAKIRKKNKTIY